MKDFAYFCPACGSPSVQRSALAGGAASCNSCHWGGKNEDLHAVPFEHDFTSPEQVIERFATEFRGVVAQSLAAPLGSVLLKWGFIDRQDLATDLAIYMRAIAAAGAKAIFETREGIATGKIKRQPSPEKVAKKGMH